MEKTKIENCTKNCGLMRRKVRVDFSSRRKKQQ
jgi:hypothetical protein